MGGRSPNAVLRNEFGIWCIAKCETHSLFAKFIFRHDLIPRCLQQMHQFRVWQWNVLKLFPVRHSEPLFSSLMADAQTAPSHSLDVCAENKNRTICIICPQPL